MSYEIPKELKYEEKIIFNFSIWQSLWIAVSFVLSGIIFLKANIAFELKIVFCIAILAAGIGFAFFNLKDHLNSVVGFAAKPREFGFFSPQMQKFLGVKKIENDSLILLNGTAKAIIEIAPVNFQSLQKKEQESVIFAYRDFLNSLDFPIQIIAKTADLSLDDYFAHLDQICILEGNRTLLPDLKCFMDDFAQKNSVKNRLFYIVIPSDRKYSDNDGLFLDSLDIRAGICIKKLENCGLKSTRLSDNEIAKLLLSYFDEKISSGQTYTSALTFAGN